MHSVSACACCVIAKIFTNHGAAVALCPLATISSTTEGVRSFHTGTPCTCFVAICLFLNKAHGQLQPDAGKVTCTGHYILPMQSCSKSNLTPQTCERVTRVVAVSAHTIKLAAVWTLQCHLRLQCRPGNTRPQFAQVAISEDHRYTPRHSRAAAGACPLQLGHLAPATQPRLWTPPDSLECSTEAEA